MRGKTFRGSDPSLFGPTPLHPRTRTSTRVLTGTQVHRREYHGRRLGDDEGLSLCSVHVQLPGSEVGLAPDSPVHAPAVGRSVRHLIGRLATPLCVTSTCVGSWIKTSQTQRPQGGKKLKHDVKVIEKSGLYTHVSPCRPLGAKGLHREGRSDTSSLTGGGAKDGSLSPR